MDVLMACSEFSPIVEVGAVADAVAALAKTLSRLEHKVCVALPKYAALDEAGLMLARRLTPLRFVVGGAKVEATLFDARLTSGVELVLIDIPGLYDRPASDGQDDDAKRFGLYCRALAELVHKRAKDGAPFDAVHVHDWPTALLAHILKRDERPTPRTVLTVHDASQHGRFPKAVIDEIGLDWADFVPDALEYYGDVNFLKAGALAADAIGAVSPSYADGLTVDGAGGLEGVFKTRKDVLSGIMNGIDYAAWSPATDAHLVARYDAEDAANKGRCKAALLHELDLSLEPERPLLIALGPVSERHGSDILARALADVVRTGARVVIGGAKAADAALVAMLEDAAASSRDEVVFLPDVSDPMRHRMVAAADAVLIPSRVEPCGALQLQAQRYGSLPVAHATGGLADGIVDCDAPCETGTGFLFDEATPGALIGAVQRAVSAMQTPQWGALRRRVMRLDLSWERPARRYARLYQPR